MVSNAGAEIGTLGWTYLVWYETVIAHNTFKLMIHIKTLNTCLAR
jgi:hypothetical protein